MTYKPITLTDRFNILHHFSLTVSLSQLTLEADQNKIPHKICFNMLKQNQIKDFPQNSRKVKRVVIIELPMFIITMGNSVALDFDRSLIQ